jgi:hypothetical protein
MPLSLVSTPESAAAPQGIGNARLLRSHCSGAFLHHIRRPALPAVMLAVAVVLAAVCSSTGAGYNARLISPMPNNQQATNSEDAGTNHRGVPDLILSASARGLAPEFLS